MAGDSSPAPGGMDAGVNPTPAADDAAVSLPPVPPAPEETHAAEVVAAEAGGARVEAAPELLIDPVISREKFAREVAEYRRMEREYLSRGWLLLRAEFPEVVVAFAAPHLNPHVVLFAVCIDFTNYDLWPPSVRFVNPFSFALLRGQDLLARFPQRRPRRREPTPSPVNQLAESPTAQHGAEPHARPPGDPNDTPATQPEPLGAVFETAFLVQAMADERPFLCIAGVREYHEHPFHTNDPWLAHRGTGAGRLLHLLNVLHQHGVVPVDSLHFQLTQVQFQFAGYTFKANAIPEGPPA